RRVRISFSTGCLMLALDLMSGLAAVATTTFLAVFLTAAFFAGLRAATFLALFFTALFFPTLFLALFFLALFLLAPFLAEDLAARLPRALDLTDFLLAMRDYNPCS